jgi:anti-sigma factor RsiW
VDCNQCRNLLHPYLDGELDLVRHLEVEQHLHDCEACMGLDENHRSLRVALGGDGLYYRAPEALRRRLQVSLGSAGGTVGGRRRTWWVRIGVSTAAAALLLVGWALGRAGVGLPATGPSPDDRLAQQVLAFHVRSLLPADHLVDVKSSDRHTVKPWFTGKVDFAPQVPDLAAEGFPLVGGRLDYVDGRSVAALVYQRRQHVINVFVWPAAGPETPVRSETRQGYHLLHGTEAGMAWWAVSDLNEGELQEFVGVLQRGLRGS